MPKSQTNDISNTSPYIAPKELSKRWGVSRSSVDRIARREGFTRLYLGVGRNGAVRYLIAEVEVFEEERLVEMAPEEDGFSLRRCRGPPSNPPSKSALTL